MKTIKPITTNTPMTTPMMIHCNLEPSFESDSVVFALATSVIDIFVVGVVVIVLDVGIVVEVVVVVVVVVVIVLVVIVLVDSHNKALVKYAS